MRLPFESDATDEFEAAAARYERERTGYGSLFVSEVRSKVDRAARFPQSGAKVPGFDPSQDVRRFILKRFPFSVVTAIIDGRRAVVPVAHGKRSPGYWHDRLDT